jgi:23S rRNA pseudouridine2605 synthase
LIPAEDAAGQIESWEIHMPAERLQKIIAAAGIASRRKAEELISAGHVKVNGTVVTELGTKADADVDHIRVDGKLLQGAQLHVYLLLNKPKGYVTTVSDPENRPTVMQLIRGVKKRVYPVGRLDYASEGLLLLTNDGALANKLMKAASQVPKTYVVKVAGSERRRAGEVARRGFDCDRRWAAGADRACRHSAGEGSQQSVVRSYVDRGAQPRDSAHV